MAVLQQKSGPAPLAVFAPTARTTRLGRQADCEIFLASPDVSRCHAQIKREDGRFIVEDMQSRNGTQVNGHTISGPVVLEDGDEIEISSTHFAFLTDDPLLADSSPSGYAPSAIRLSSGASSGSSEIPLAVGQGDLIPASVFGQHELDANTVVTRLSVGLPDRGWPTLRHPEEKLLLALRLQNRLRGGVSKGRVLSLVVETLFDLFAAAERIAVILQGPDGNGFVVAAAGSRDAGDEVRISIPLLFSAMEAGESVLCVGGEQPKPDSDGSAPDLVVQYLLGVTLVGADRGIRGALQIETRRSGGFEPKHAECLAVLSHVISCRLDDCAAASAEQRQALLNRSTETAARLRRHLTPVKHPQIDGFRVRHQVMTVPDVAADLVDYIPLNDGRLACYILDVPGRGPEAAALMAAISRVVNRALMVSGSTASAICMVEAELRTRMSEVPMVTSLCIAILDPDRSAVSVSIAGHCPVWHFSQSGVAVPLDRSISGPPLGAPREVCQHAELCLADDDVLLLCSDGIARIPSDNGSLVSPAGIGRLLERADMDTRLGLEDRVMFELQSLSGASTLQDDVVLLAIHKTDSVLSDSSVLPADDLRVLT